MNATQLLRQHNLKATPARLSILAILEAQHGPLTAHDIAQHPHLKTMDQATLYRNLHHLTQAKIIRPLDILGPSTHYELTSLGDHHHIICQQCGAIEELAGCPLQELNQQIVSQSHQFAQVNHHSLEFYGLCHHCC